MKRSTFFSVIDRVLLMVNGIALLVFFTQPLFMRFNRPVVGLDAISTLGTENSLASLLLLAVVLCWGMLLLLALMRMLPEVQHHPWQRVNLINSLFAFLRKHIGTEQKNLRFSVGLSAFALAAWVIFPQGSFERYLAPSYSFLLVVCLIPNSVLTVIRLPAVLKRLRLPSRAGRVNANMDIYLDVVSGPLVGAQPRIDVKKLYKIGRSEENDLVFFNDRHVSEQMHACIFYQGNRSILRAYAVMNLNEQPIQPGDYPLNPGDLLQVGYSKMYYRAQ